jgi:hypothetical protein
MSMVINAKTFTGLDFGLGPKPPPVAPVGLEYAVGPVTCVFVMTWVVMRRPGTRW